MNIIDIENPKRIDKPPDNEITIFSSSKHIEQGYQIKNVKIRLYIENNDEEKGPYSLITSQVETDKGTVEMKYDEGYKGKNALSDTVDFLINNLGISGLVIRSIITLQGMKD